MPLPINGNYSRLLASDVLDLAAPDIIATVEALEAACNSAVNAHNLALGELGEIDARRIATCFNMMFATVMADPSRPIFIAEKVQTDFDGLADDNGWLSEWTVVTAVYV